MKTYTFEVICPDGQPRNFEFQAENFNQARTMLQQLQGSQPNVQPDPMVQTAPVVEPTNIVRSSGTVSYF